MLHVYDTIGFDSIAFLKGGGIEHPVEMLVVTFITFFSVDFLRIFAFTVTC